jgi:hypothetical protein
MTKASDNAFPSLLITEGTEPSAPAAGKQRLYIDSTSHHLSLTNSSGTETDLQALSSTFSGCKVKNSGTQSRATNSTFLWDQEDYDTGTYHDTGSNTGNMVIPATGKYHVGAFIKSNGTITAGKYILYIQNNGADLPAAQQDSAALAAGGVQLTVSADAVLTVGDILTVKCASAGTTTWDTGCRFWIHRIG